MLFIDSHREIFALALVLAASLVAAIFDIRTRRIPNALVLLLFVSGFAASLLAGPFVAALDVVITGAVLLLGTVAFSLKLIGGGDVKAARRCGRNARISCCRHLRALHVHLRGHHRYRLFGTARAVRAQPLGICAASLFRFLPA